MISKKKLASNIISIVITLFAVFAFKSSVLGNYKIPTGSMEPTILIGDRVLASQISFSIRIPFSDTSLNGFKAPSRGDVVVFEYPENRSIDYVKRVIGLPGDTIEINKGVLYINEEEVHDKKESWDKLNAGEKFTTGKFELMLEDLQGHNHYVMKKNQYSHDQYGPVSVPEGMLFVMGDNRDDSHDSRAWGFLPVEYVRAKVLFAYFSLEKGEKKFFPAIRWDRMGKKIE